MGRFLIAVILTLGAFYLAVYGETLKRYELTVRHTAELRDKIEFLKESIKELPLVQQQRQKVEASFKADKRRCLPYNFEAVRADLKSLARPFPHLEMGMSPEVFIVRVEESPPPGGDEPEALQGFGSQGAHLRLTGPRAEVIGFLTAVLQSEHRYVIKTGKLTPEGPNLKGEVFLGPIPPPR